MFKWIKKQFTKFGKQFTAQPHLDEFNYGLNAPIEILVPDERHEVITKETKVKPKTKSTHKQINSIYKEPSTPPRKRPVQSSKPKKINKSKLMKEDIDQNSINEIKSDKMVPSAIKTKVKSNKPRIKTAK